MREYKLYTINPYSEHEYTIPEHKDDGGQDGHTFSHIHLVPVSSADGAEGTMFYCSDDNSIYVATE